jgi:hypothetical protein
MWPFRKIQDVISSDLSSHTGEIRNEIMPPQPNPAIAALCADIVARPERYEHHAIEGDKIDSIESITLKFDPKVGLFNVPVRVALFDGVNYDYRDLRSFRADPQIKADAVDESLIAATFVEFVSRARRSLTAQMEARIWEALKPDAAEDCPWHNLRLLPSHADGLRLRQAVVGASGFGTQDRQALNVIFLAMLPVLDGTHKIVPIKGKKTPTRRGGKQ